MIRQLVPKPAERPNGFRWRGGHGSRVESFSDAVFAFALTLLVISLSPPRDFGELNDALGNLLGFAMCFATLVWVWHEHCVWFRRYGMTDALTVTINAALLFVVLFYVYPLRLMFSMLAYRFFGVGGDSARTLVRGMTWEQGIDLLVLYGVGFALIFALFALLYRRALSARTTLGLDEIEEYDTRTSLGACVISTAVAVLSLVLTGLANMGSAALLPIAGFSYALLGPAHAYWGFRRGRGRSRLAPRA